MGVNVDKAGCDRQTGGIKYFIAMQTQRWCDRDDFLIGDGDVGAIRRSAATVDDVSVADDDVVAWRLHGFCRAGATRAVVDKVWRRGFHPPYILEESIDGGLHLVVIINY